MATAIFFGGRRINDPGAYSVIDASGLAGKSPASVGVVALVGTAEGGKPLSVDSTFSDFTRPEKVLETYRSGNLRTAGQFAFAPSLDPAVPGGASRLVCVKVNPATQATLTLPDALAADSVDLTSSDWGLFTNQINVTVAAGTTQGKLITVIFEDITEVFDDVGGDEVFDLLYTPSTDGYDTALATLTSSLLSVATTKAETGLAAELTTATPAGLPAGLEAVSSDAGDTTQTLTLYGLAAGVAVQETITLTGTSAAPTALLTWSHCLGYVLSAAAVGTVTVRVAGGGASVGTIAPTTPATLTRGVVQVTNGPCAGALTVSMDADTAVDVAMFGTTAAGAAVGEVFDMTAGSTTPVVGSTTFGTLSIMALGEAAAGRTTTVTNTAISANLSVYNTVRRLTDYLNSLAGVTATETVTNPTTYDPALLDAVTAQSCRSAAYNFLGDLQAFVTAINNGSAYVDAAVATGATAVPANTAGAVYLTGAVEGTPTATEWQTAFTLLKQRRINTIVPLTEDTGVQALLATLLVEKAGRLRSEANGWLGAGTTAGAGETKTTIKSQIQALGTRHLSVVSQECKRSNPDTLVEEWFPPYMYAAIHAGMQAGSPVGEPLTYKKPFVTDIRQDSSWTPEDDREELIDAGLVMSEKVEGLGIRIIRSITTHLADDNVVFTEMSANEAANHAVFTLRRQMELKIGQRGLAGSVASLKGLAAAALEELRTDDIIVAWRSLSVEQLNDVFPISVEVAPVLPINFIPITVHLVAVRIAA